MADIWTYIAEASPAITTDFLRQIESKFDLLRDHPELGPSRDHLARGLRAHFHRNHAIYYRATDTELIIVRVVHGSRDAVALFSGDWADP